MEGALIGIAVLAAAAHLGPSGRARALSMAGALGLTPALLVAHVWDSPQLHSVRDRPATAVVAGALALVAVAALATLFVRRPAALALAAAAAIPFRVPIPLGATTASLLLPLYLVIASGAVAYIVPRLRDTDEVEGRRPGAAE